jgi:hypothetical protein
LFLVFLFASACFLPRALGQQLSAASASEAVIASPDASISAAASASPEAIVTPETSVAPEPLPKHILGVIPNYRTSPSLTNYMPISPKEKFDIARKDSLDRGTVVLAGAFAGYGQLTNASPSFGQGVEGYAHYFGTSFADLVIGNYMSEAVFPILLHQDPRYFRRGIGSASSRLGYSVGQIFLTHSDSGRTQFNYSEIAGNSAAVAISNAYYPDNRSVSNSAIKLGMQLGVDMASNVLKEFWPDITRRFSRKHRQQLARN